MEFYQSLRWRRVVQKEMGAKKEGGREGERWGGGGGEGGAESTDETRGVVIFLKTPVNEDEDGTVLISYLSIIASHHIPLPFNNRYYTTRELQLMSY